MLAVLLFCDCKQGNFVNYQQHYGPELTSKFVSFQYLEKIKGF